MTCTDSADSSLHVGPPRHAASPQPTRPPRVSMRTKAKFISCSVVNDMWCGRLTGMSARETRTSAIVRSLGIGSFVVRLRAAGREAAGVEERQVHRRLAVAEPVGDRTSGGGRVLEAVPAEADGEEEPLHARRPADDRVIVGRQRPKPRPAAGDLRRFQHGDAAHRLVHRLVETAPVHRHLEVRADVLDVTRAQQHLLHLLAEVEAARAVGGERDGPGDLGEGLGEEDVTTARLHEDLDARQAPDRGRHRSRRIDYQRRRYRAVGRRDAGDAIVSALDRGDAHALGERHAALARAPREAVGDLRRTGEAVARAPHGGHEVVDAQRGHELLRVVGGDHAHVDAEPVLQRDPRLEAAQVRGIADEEQVADLLVADVDAELVLEALEDLDGLEREPDLRLGRELRADAAGGLRGGAAADRLALEHDDVAHAAAREVVGDRAAHHAAADDHDAGGAGEGHVTAHGTPDRGAIILLAREDSTMPDLLFTEVANALWKRVRRAETTMRAAVATLATLDAVRFQVHPSRPLLPLALELAAGFGRTVYDSVYLAVAMIRHCPLVTADRRLYDALAAGALRSHLLWVADVP